MYADSLAILSALRVTFEQLIGCPLILKALWRWAQKHATPGAAVTAAQLKMACNVCVVHVDSSEECYWPKGGVTWSTSSRTRHGARVPRRSAGRGTSAGRRRRSSLKPWRRSAVSMKVKKKAKAASDDAAVQLGLLRRSWPAPSLPIHSGGPWYSTVGQCTTPRLAQGLGRQALRTVLETPPSGRRRRRCRHQNSDSQASVATLGVPHPGRRLLPSGAGGQPNPPTACRHGVHSPPRLGTPVRRR